MILWRESVRLIVLQKCASSSLRECFEGEQIQEGVKTPGHKLTSVFVRNPYARLVSCWYDLVYSKRFTFTPELFDRSAKRPALTFRQFVNKVCDLSDDEMDIHFEPQFSQIQRVLDDSMIWMGRVESLHSDWVTFGEVSGLTLKPMIQKRKSNHDPWPAMYTDGLFKIVDLRFADDLRMWKNLDPYTPQHGYVSPSMY